jgi:hypothetical protein
MKNKKELLLSRREFAQRAALFSVSLVPTSLVLKGGAPAGEAPQQQENLPKLSPESQVEADARLQQILSQYGSRFDAEEKTLLQTLCVFAQPSLDRIRAFHLENGDAPALYLKPLVEREKKPQASPAAGAATGAAKKS